MVLSTTSNDGQSLVLSGWGYQIDDQGHPVLDGQTSAPIATVDSPRTVELSGVLSGTHALYDGWCSYVPDTGVVIDPSALPDGWTSGQGDPTGAPAYGSTYCDTVSGKAWIYNQGCLNQAAQSFADALEAQIDNAAKLAALGL